MDTEPDGVEETPSSGNESLNSEDVVVSHLEISVNVPPGTEIKISIKALPLKDRDEEARKEAIVRYSDDRGIQEEHILLLTSPVETLVVGTSSVKAGPRLAQQNNTIWQVKTKAKAWIKAWPYSFEYTLFGLSLFIYLVVRLVGLTEFPIYFFADEAIQTTLASDFIRDNFKNADGEYFPTYFYNVDKYSLSATVYLHILPYLIFGKSAFATRLTSVLITLLAAICVGLILRDAFRFPYWWCGTLVLSAAPAWFLHSRTAFETVTMVSFYAAGLYAYLLYRYRAPKYLYLSILLFGLAFYSYNPGQVVVVLTGMLLLISDARYHWDNRRTALVGLGLVALLTVPYIRFRLEHPLAVEDQLVTLNSYWIQPITFQEKIKTFVSEYLYGLSPGYWFVPNERDMVRHLMRDYALLHRVTFIFFIIGLLIAIKNFRSSAHRTVIIAWLAAPAGAAIVQIAVTRILVMVIPATLIICIGLISILKWLKERVSRGRLISLVLFGILAGMNFWMLADALLNGATWFRDYGLSGMQYGGEQVFSEVENFMRENPEAEVIVSPSWANGTDVIARFFLYDPLPIQMGSIDDYLPHRLELSDRKVFVMTPEEYERAVVSGKFENIKIHRTLPYPDGRKGFYFVSLEYVDNIDEILAAEYEVRRQLQESEIVLFGELTQVRYSLLDMGEIGHLWDGNRRTLTRTFEANPYIIEVTFPETRKINGMSMIIGDTNIRLVAKLFESEETEPVEYIFEREGSVKEPEVSVDFGQERSVTILYLEIYDLLQTEPGHVHIWEIQFR